MRSWLAERAPEIFDFDSVRLPSLLGLDQLGIEWIDDKRIVNLGKLPVVHGHEFKGWGGVMPARWLYLKTGATALCGHFHQPSYYTFRTLESKDVGCWSTGCACYLSPQWLPMNQWGHGYAIVEVGQGGQFAVNNRRLLRDGRVV